MRYVNVFLSIGSKFESVMENFSCVNSPCAPSPQLHFGKEQWRAAAPPPPAAPSHPSWEASGGKIGQIKMQIQVQHPKYSTVYSQYRHTSFY